MDYDPLTASAEENNLRDKLEKLEAGAAVTELIAEIDDEHLDTEEAPAQPASSEDPADYPLFARVDVCVDGEWMVGEGAYVAARPDPKMHPGQVFVFREHHRDGSPLRATKWYPADEVRLVAFVPVKPHEGGIPSSSSSKLGKAVAITSVNALSRGYDTSWPACFNFWRYDHLSSEAVNLNAYLYPEVLARISAKDVKEVCSASRGTS